MRNNKRIAVYNPLWDACCAASGRRLKACPHQATNCCRKRQQNIAENGNIVAAPVKVAVSGNNLLPFSALWCGQALMREWCDRISRWRWWLESYHNLCQSQSRRKIFKCLNIVCRWPARRPRFDSSYPYWSTRCSCRSCCDHHCHCGSRHAS